jgi:hypothetical protein
MTWGVHGLFPRFFFRSRVPLSDKHDGWTWPWVRDVQERDETTANRPEEEIEYSYPSVTQSHNGMIQLAFTLNRKTIKYMTFDEPWIRQGTTRGLFAGDPKP